LRSRGGDRLKLLYWDRAGYVLWYKRLEKGCFHLPESFAAAGRLAPRQLAMILEGLEEAAVRRRVRFTLERP
jgi:transposase